MASPPHDKIIHDLLIVGAGVYGIYAANTYLSLHPTASLACLDGDSGPGGVWSNPQFWSQSGTRLSGYPDKPFRVPEGAETYHDLFEAKYLSAYLEEHLTEHVYDGRKLRQRFIFACWVTHLEKGGDGVWEVRAKLNGNDVTYRATKIIVATGLSSIPNMPDLPHKENFQGPILHQKDFGRSNILTADEPEKETHPHHRPRRFQVRRRYRIRRCHRPLPPKESQLDHPHLRPRSPPPEQGPSLRQIQIHARTRFRPRYRFLELR